MVRAPSKTGVAGHTHVSLRITYRCLAVRQHDGGDGPDSEKDTNGDANDGAGAGTAARASTAARISARSHTLPVHASARSHTLPVRASGGVSASASASAVGCIGIADSTARRFI